MRRLLGLSFAECVAALVALTHAPTTLAALSQEGPTTNKHNRRRAIIGGRVADPERYPYFVRLDYDGYVGCGGTLVALDMVVTAAHCVYDEDVDVSSIVLAFGSEPNTQRRIITRVFPHPAYDDPSNRYDVAVIQLKKPIENNASLVQLARTNHSEWGLHHQPFADVKVVVIGWGVTAEDSDVSDVLREATLRVVPDDECQEGYTEGTIHPPSMICAATDANEGPCYRDSGGPLLLLGEGKKSDLQVGIVSFGGDNCADPRQHSVFVDVANVQSWVNRVVCQYSTMRPPEITCKADSLVDSMTDDGPVIVVEDNTETDDTLSSSAFILHQTRSWLRAPSMMSALALLAVHYCW